MLSWHQLILPIPEAEFEPFRDDLVNAGACGFWVQEHQVVAYFEHWSPDLQSEIEALIAPCSFRVESIVPTDFVAQFQREWTRFELAPHVWMVPSWEQADFIPQPDDTVLYMDPGSAFGTGHHETTRLCAMAIKQYALEKKPMESVWDLGCGTGILGILWAKLGAKQVFLTDIDVKACETTKENALINQLFNTHVHTQLPKNQWGKQNAIVANILSEPLLHMSSQLYMALKDQGTLFLSGILNHQAQKLIQVYQRVGFTHLATHTQGEWVLLHFKKDNQKTNVSGLGG